MSFTTINAPDAPKALGSYSHGIKSGSMILTSGQIALDPKTGVLEKETCASMLSRSPPPALTMARRLART